MVIKAGSFWLAYGHCTYLDARSHRGAGRLCDVHIIRGFAWAGRSGTHDLPRTQTSSK